jgi:hypothetical protein
MLPASDVARIAEVCKSIGNQATDNSGFVAVRDLLSRFSADLQIRPLLVEGMLASVDKAGRTGNRWAVLVDSDTYPYTKKDVEQERSTRPLHYRMRNTIAHELVHALAFRADEFGLHLTLKTDTKESIRAFVEAIEEKTEQFSPLLLWSEKAIEMLLQGRRDSLALADLLYVVENFGVSRYVLINRLRLLRPTDSNGLLFSKGLSDLALGIGVWGVQHIQIKGWPVFVNFDHTNIPSFLWKISGHQSVPAQDLFVDPRFAMLGGPENTIEMETTAGTKEAPNSRKMKVQISVEEGLRKAGEEFLFVVRRI